MEAFHLFLEKFKEEIYRGDRRKFGNPYFYVMFEQVLPDGTLVWSGELQILDFDGMRLNYIRSSDTPFFPKPERWNPGDYWCIDSIKSRRFLKPGLVIRLRMRPGL